MAYISDYRDGTVSLNTGTKDLVGDGSAWTLVGIRTGDLFLKYGFVGIVEEVVDDNHITLRDEWGGPTLPAGSTYSIKFSPDQSRVQASVVALINRLSSGVIDELVGLDYSGGDKLIYNDAPGSLALSALTPYGRSLLGGADASAVLTALGFSDFGKSLRGDADAAARLTALGVSAFIRTLLGNADAAAARTTLGVGAANSPTFQALTLSNGQIAFPATQISSSNPNTLDDYEEGSWTPSLSFGLASTSIAYGTRTGDYTKVGNLVNAAFDMTLTNKGSATGAVGIEGFPFVGAGTLPSGTIGYFANMDSLIATGTYLGLRLQVGTGRAVMVQGSNASYNIVGLTDIHFTNTSRVIGSISYTTVS